MSFHFDRHNDSPSLKSGSSGSAPLPDHSPATASPPSSTAALRTLPWSRTFSAVEHSITDRFYRARTRRISSGTCWRRLMLPRVPDKIPAMSPHFFKLEWPLPKSAPVSAPPRTSSTTTLVLARKRSTFRLARTPDGEPGLNYLCPSYKAFFHHVNRPMRAMSGMHRARRAPAGVMKLYAAHDAKRTGCALYLRWRKPLGDCQACPRQAPWRRSPSRRLTPRPPTRPPPAPPEHLSSHDGPWSILTSRIGS